MIQPFLYCQLKSYMIVYFEVWKKEGKFAHLVSLKNTIGRCVVPCNCCEIVNI